jgi:hypothetical protein
LSVKVTRVSERRFELGWVGGNEIELHFTPASLLAHSAEQAFLEMGDRRSNIP